MKKFSMFAVGMLLVALPTASYAQCSNGSCSTGRGRSMSSMMMAAPAWGGQMQHMAPQSSAPSEIASSTRTMDFYVNAERQRNNLPPVKVDETLSRDLVDPLREVVSEGHAKPIKGHSTQVVSKGGNLVGTFAAWMDNPQMRAKILSPTYKTCAFAAVRADNGTIYRVLVMR